MFTTDRWAVATAWAALGLCVALSGCQKEEPAEPKRAPVPKIPATPPPKDAAPAAPGPVAASRPAAEPPLTPTSAPSPELADEEDAPDAPRFFPRSRVVADWVKHEPVRTALPGDLADLLPADTANVISPYQVKQAATCAYRRTVANRQQVMRVLAVLTHQPADAFGIFTVEGTGALSKDSGLMTRTDVSGERTIIHAWKGCHYLRFTGLRAGDPTFMKACQPLIRKITFLMPDAALPALVEAFPQAGRVPGRRWLIRGSGSLAGPGAVDLKIPQGEQVARLLGLNKDSQMAIATYQIQGAARPHLVWVVRYDTPSQARRAHRAYMAWLDEATDRASASTMLLKPRGQYLLGTWTAEEESLGSVLPKLQANLD